MVQTERFKLSILKTFKHAIVYRVDNEATLVIASTADYIPIDEFKSVFVFAGETVKQEEIRKLVFDKRTLSIFHQPSMEWYFISWKEEMWSHGLTIHRKILPNDTIFRESVKIGREKIFRENPNLKAKDMDIQYRDDLEEAIAE